MFIVSLLTTHGEPLINIFSEFKMQEFGYGKARQKGPINFRFSNTSQHEALVTPCDITYNIAKTNFNPLGIVTRRPYKGFKLAFQYDQYLYIYYMMIINIFNRKLKWYFVYI